MLSCVLRAETTLDTCREMDRDEVGTYGRGKVEVGWGLQIEHKGFGAKNGAFSLFLRTQSPSTSPPTRPTPLALSPGNPQKTNTG